MAYDEDSGIDVFARKLERQLVERDAAIAELVKVLRNVIHEEGIAGLDSKWATEACAVLAKYAKER